ncbi:hypothetical protein A3709_20685 [Halioglobus sp. HI00S01]|uniref:AAA family ATPase n=1 Tax=Halioglobus sp. HI00S01 TaxID=1822214 RepID=UPI0007C34C22|nr:AAA family ATPase [Halioglobus sp. HI00S01]KZX58031.1 hypothetical protein A3709_20685 [Halioglobus sp. HI00S01]
MDNDTYSESAEAPTHNEKVLEKIDQWISRGESKIQAVKNYVQENARERRYKGDELLKVIGIGSLSRIYQAENAGRLPPGDRDEKGRRIGYTLAQVRKAQQVFGTSPRRSVEDEPVTLAFTNFKGGCWKTTSSWHFTTWAAAQGYRVLAIDIDPQASLTRNLGIMPDVDTSWENSVAPYIMLERPLEDVSDVIVNTAQAGLDLIPGTLALQDAEWLLANHMFTNRNTGNVVDQAKTFLRLKDVVSRVRNRYDIVVIDGTPTLGLLPLNLVFAADCVVVPTPTEYPDFCSTISFLTLLHTQFESLNDLFGEQMIFPDLSFLATKFAPGGKTVNTLSSELVLEDMIRPVFQEAALENIITKHDAVVGKLVTVGATVFQAPRGEQGIKKDQWERAEVNFSSVAQEIMDKLVIPRWSKGRSQEDVA